MPSNSCGQRCSTITTWGRCQQNTTHESGLCSAHLNWHLRGSTPDPYYHRKVVEAKVQPTWDWMSDAEAHALLNGRYRGDGRRIDQWVLPEGGLGIDL